MDTNGFWQRSMRPGIGIVIAIGGLEGLVGIVAASILGREDDVLAITAAWAVGIFVWAFCVIAVRKHETTSRTHQKA